MKSVPANFKQVTSSGTPRPLSKRLLLLAVLLLSLAAVGCISSAGGQGVSQTNPSVEAPAASPSQAALEPSALAQSGATRVISVNAYAAGSFVKVFGEVENAGKFPIQFVSVKIFYQDGEGGERSSTQIAKMHYLEPGWKSPFDLALFKSKVGDVKKVRAEVSGFGRAEPFYTGLQVVEKKGEAFGSLYGRYYRVSGSVENKGTEPFSFGWAVVTFYDAQGNVVEDGVAALGTREKALAPGSSQPFSVQAEMPPVANITSYSVGISYEKK